MQIVGPEGQPLLDVDDTYKLGEKIGFNFGLGETPNLYWVFTILAVDGDIATVGAPQRIVPSRGVVIPLHRNPFVSV